VVKTVSPEKAVVVHFVVYEWDAAPVPTLLPATTLPQNHIAYTNPGKGDSPKWEE